MAYGVEWQGEAPKLPLPIQSAMCGPTGQRCIPHNNKLSLLAGLLNCSVPFSALFDSNLSGK